jgi:tRNA pseudouridine55 synthase
MTARHDLPPPSNGIVLVDKPTGMTSHDVVTRMRRVAGTRQVGHTGTLDPMAEGLLIICIGGATRIAQFLSGLDKVYVGTITLGAISPTYDAEGTITPQEGRPIPDDAATLREAMRAQLGERIQLPPPYSAVKVGGKKLYQYARQGEEAPQKPRHVHVQRFDLLRYQPPDAEFEARVASGTYIRSMAHDLGIALGCGAYLSRLRRTRVGSMSVEDAVPLETLVAEPALLAAHLLGVTEALGHLPKVTIHPAMRHAIAHGRAFSTRDVLEADGILAPGRPVLVLSTSGEALSVVQAEPLAPAASDDPEDGGDDGLPGLGATPLVFKPLRVLAKP